MGSTQKIIFVVIVAIGLLVASMLSLAYKVLPIWFGPPNLDATMTVVSIRGTEAAIAVTEAALKGTLTPLPTNTSDGADSPDSPSMGEAGHTWNGLKIEIIDVKQDGWPLVQAHNQFNDPPLDGKRMLLVTVKVSAEPNLDVLSINAPNPNLKNPNMKNPDKAQPESVSAEPISINQSDFEMVGERGEFYNTFNDQTSCGVVPDSLNGVVAQNYSITGAICVQVPEDERNFTLIYETMSGGTPAVYINLPEPE